MTTFCITFYEYSTDDPITCKSCRHGPFKFYGISYKFRPVLGCDEVGSTRQCCVWEKTLHIVKKRRLFSDSLPSIAALYIEWNPFHLSHFFPLHHLPYICDVKGVSHSWNVTLCDERKFVIVIVIFTHLLLQTRFMPRTQLQFSLLSFFSDRWRADRQHLRAATWCVVF
jgi:hypothetical protein